MDRLYTVLLTNVSMPDEKKLEFDTNVTVAILAALNAIRATSDTQFGKAEVIVASNRVPELRKA